MRRLLLKGAVVFSGHGKGAILEFVGKGEVGLCLGLRGLLFFFDVHP